MTAAVEITDLVVRYGPVEAVRGLSLTAAAGAVTAVLGPNGAGKTTSVETCEGYRRPASGVVRVLGLDPLADRARLHARVGVMLQAGGVAGGVTAAQVLSYAHGLYAQPVDVPSLADRLGIDLGARTPFRRLSGGQQQRVRLALALVGRPELVFLDEPTAGLDPQARHATWDLLRDLRSDGVSVVLTTHFMDEAELLADHVVIVDAGRVVTSGAPAELTAAGAGPGTLRFTAEPGLDLTTLSPRLPAGRHVTEDRPGWYVVDGEIGPDVLSLVTAWCAEQGVMPRDLLVGRRSLEDLFLELTGRELR